MARLVKRFRSKPYAVTFGGETQYICGCGLSAKPQDYPYRLADHIANCIAALQSIADQLELSSPTQA